MKEHFYEDFFYNDDNVNEVDHKGNPYTVESAIGRIVLNFADLEREFSSVIAFLLQVKPEAGSTVTAELSFKNKLNLISALYRQCTVDQESLDWFSALMKLLQKCEELRNQIVHSHWFDAREAGVLRVKPANSQRKGHFVKSEELLPMHLMNISDYIAYTIEKTCEYFSCIDGYKSATWEQIGY